MCDDRGSSPLRPGGSAKRVDRPDDARPSRTKHQAVLARGIQYIFKEASGDRSPAGPSVVLRHLWLQSSPLEH